MALRKSVHARELHVRVPEDVSVVGFDDIPESARTTPPLTTVRQAHDDKGRTATALLLDLLAGRKVPSRKHLQTRLMRRGSSAAPAKGSAARKAT